MSSRAVPLAMVLVSCRDPLPSWDAAVSTLDASVSRSDAHPDRSVRTHRADVSDAAVARDSTDVEALVPGCPRPTHPAFVNATITDRDRDGHNDWVTRSGFVAHAGPDGTCSLNDEWTRFELRSRCPWVPLRIVEFATETDDPELDNSPIVLEERVRCLRVWGLSSAEALARLRTELREGAPLRRWGLTPDAAVEHTSLVLAPASIAALEDVARESVPLRLTLGSAPSLPASWTPGAESLDGGAPDATGEDSPSGTADALSVPDGAVSLALRIPHANVAVRRECARIEARATALVRRSVGPILDPRNWNPPSAIAARLMGVSASIGQCFDAVGGAWAMDTAGAARTSDPENPRVAIPIRVRWLGNDGVRLDRPEREFETGDYDTHEVEHFGTTDYDHDGRDELLARRVEHLLREREGILASPLQIFTVHNGSIELFSPAAVGPFARAEDFDHDGRIDLIDEHTYGYATCDPTVVGYAVWPLLVHALPDGTFTRDDAVTQRFQQARCSEIPRSFAAGLSPRTADDEDERYYPEAMIRDGFDFLPRALCARFAGWSPERVQLAVLAAMRAVDSVPARFLCHSWNELSYLLRVRSPFARPIPGTMR